MQVEIFVKRFGNTKLTPADCTSLSEQIGNGPWSPEQKEFLAQGLASAMTHNEAGGSKRRPNQTMKSFVKFLTDSDLDALSDSELHPIQKVKRVVDRCLALGLHLPSESTIKHIVKTAMDCTLDIHYNTYTIFNHVAVVCYCVFNMVHGAFLLCSPATSS